MRDRFDTSWLTEASPSSADDHIDDPRVLEMQHAAIEVATYAYNNELSDDALANLLMLYADKYDGLIKREVCVEGEYRLHRPDSVETQTSTSDYAIGYYDGLTIEHYVSDNSVPFYDLRHRIASSKNGNDTGYITTDLSTPLSFPTVMSPEKAKALLERIQPLVDETDEAIAGSHTIATMIKELSEIDFDVQASDPVRALTYKLLAQNMGKTAQFLFEKGYDTQLSGSIYNQGLHKRTPVYGNFTLVKPQIAFCLNKEGVYVPALSADVVDHNVFASSQRVTDGLVPFTSIKSIEPFTSIGFVD